jgi:ribonucleoside-diphosphate reductase alpha chain
MGVASGHDGNGHGGAYMGRFLSRGYKSFGRRRWESHSLDLSKLNGTALSAFDPSANMFVIKRSSGKELMSFDKISERLIRLSEDPFQPYPPSRHGGAVCVVDDDPLCTGAALKGVNPHKVAHKVCAGIYDGITTVELDKLASEEAAAMQSVHPEYGVLASRIVVSNLQKTTPTTFGESVRVLEGRLDPAFFAALTVDGGPLEALEDAIDYTRDYNYDYFGIKTLEKMYLLKARGGQVKERPQHMLMRVSAWINSARGEAVNVKRMLETYELMSRRYYTHATPTLFNAGTRMPQLSSCMLLNQIDTPERDSINGMYDLVKHVAQISKMAGGIGTNCTLVRSRGSYIHGSGGTSKGLVPFLRVLNETARHVDQAGVRKGAVAVFMEPWHVDIFEFLYIRKNARVEEARARDLFTALWVPDEFFRRVLADEDWALMCPNDARGLADACGDDFARLYREYKGQGIARRTVKARQLWDAILRSMIETGTPYISAKDAVNAKSGQKNLGTIRSSNLCNEVTLYSDKDETAVCVLASVALSRFVKYVDGPGSETYMDYAELHLVTKAVARNLDAVIDNTIYPTPECEASSKRHRPIGIGVQGFCDVLYALRLPLESAGAREVNVRIFETMYHAAVLASVELAEVHGAYSSFAGSPASQGLLQFDLWDSAPTRPEYDWVRLKERVRESGLRNSTLMALMPTASTSQLLQNTESFELPTSFMYSRRTLSGEFMVINRWLLRDLTRARLWTPELKQALVRNEGSIQGIERIPPQLRALYKTTWEVPMKAYIAMMQDRAPYVCQSASLNLYQKEPSMKKLINMLLYSWKEGLKTICYYLRIRPASTATKFTVESERGGGAIAEKAVEADLPVCSLEEGCVLCSA